MKFISVFIFTLFFSNISFAEKIYSEESIFSDESYILENSISKIIEESLLNEVGADEISISLLNIDRAFQLDVKKEFFNVEIEESSFDKRTRKFKYNISFSNGDFIQKIDFIGSYVEIIEIPVLSKRLVAGKIIKESDIEYIKFEKHRLRHDVIEDETDIIGKATKRSKMALKPIKSRDVEEPRIVQRRDNLDIIFQNKAITLSTSGIALEDGAKGDLIRVRNIDSNKILSAIIEDSGKVIVKNSNLL